MRIARPSPPARWARLARAAVACSLLAAGCGEPEQAVVEEAVPPSVKTLVIGSSGSGATREYTGSLAAWQHAEMAFEVPGKIVAFNAVEGQRVDAGFVLASLDPRDFAAGLKAAEANVAKARADFVRYQKLLDEGVASQADYEARKRVFEVAKAELETAEKSVEDTDLVAPFAGVMARKLVDDFQNVQAKQPVLILQDDTKYKIRVTVPEQDMAGGATGAMDLDRITQRIKPRVIVTALDDSEFPAVLYELSTTADPVTRTFDATFVMDAPATKRVLPGMTAKVRINAARLDRLGVSVPGVAVWSDEDGKSYVWKLDPQTNTVARAPVQMGDLSGSDVEIVGGLADGDVIVTSGVRGLHDGDAVRPLGARLR